MGVLALSGGDVALIILAAFWGLLVAFLCVVLVNTFRVLESTKMLLDGVREGTVPLLGEVQSTVKGVNRELERVDTTLQSVNKMMASLEKTSGLVNEAAQGPLVKVISAGAGISKSLSRLRKKR